MRIGFTLEQVKHEHGILLSDWIVETLERYWSPKHKAEFQGDVTPEGLHIGGNICGSKGGGDRWFVEHKDEKILSVIKNDVELLCCELNALLQMLEDIKATYYVVKHEDCYTVDWKGHRLVFTVTGVLV